MKIKNYTIVFRVFFNDLEQISIYFENKRSVSRFSTPDIKRKHYLRFVHIDLSAFV